MGFCLVLFALQGYFWDIKWCIITILSVGDRKRTT